MEILTGVERRRRWRLEDKLRIVAEAEQPGARFAEVARRHEVSRGQLWAWRDQVRRGVLVAEPAPVFVPVQVTAELPAPVSGAATAAAALAAPHRLETAAAGGRIEITLPDGAVIRVGEEISLAALRRVVAALRA
jgi:transposase